MKQMDMVDVFEQEDVDRQIDELIARGAIFFCCTSGGKDSQAMSIKLRGLVPKEQLIFVHAHLPEVEWDGTIDHIKDTTPEGYELIITQAGKSLFEMAERRGMWPSPTTRQCTSDLKRGPVEKVIRHALKARDELLVVNCMGLRAEESSSRAKQQVFKKNERNSKAGREWYDWLPIHDLLVDEVFRMIEKAGEEPHWIYEAGMTRCSCCFCIMASRDDLCTAARLNPALFARYVTMEKKMGHTLIMPAKGQDPKTLDVIVGEHENLKKAG